MAEQFQRSKCLLLNHIAVLRGSQFICMVLVS